MGRVCEHAEGESAGGIKKTHAHSQELHADRLKTLQQNQLCKCVNLLGAASFIHSQDQHAEYENPLPKSDPSGCDAFCFRTSKGIDSTVCLFCLYEIPDGGRVAHDPQHEDGHFQKFKMIEGIHTNKE